MHLMIIRIDGSLDYLGFHKCAVNKVLLYWVPADGVGWLNVSFNFCHVKKRVITLFSLFVFAVFVFICKASNLRKTSFLRLQEQTFDECSRSSWTRFNNSRCLYFS